MSIASKKSLVMARFILTLLALGLVVCGLVSSSPFAGEADLVSALPELNFKTNFKHYSGYLESVNGSFMHYWFFESQTGHSEKVLNIYSYSIAKLYSPMTFESKDFRVSS